MSILPVIVSHRNTQGDIAFFRTVEQDRLMLAEDPIAIRPMTIAPRTALTSVTNGVCLCSMEAGSKIFGKQRSSLASTLPDKLTLLMSLMMRLLGGQLATCSHPGLDCSISFKCQLSMFVRHTRLSACTVQGFSLRSVYFAATTHAQVGRAFRASGAPFGNPDAPLPGGVASKLYNRPVNEVRGAKHLSR